MVPVLVDEVTTAVHASSGLVPVGKKANIRANKPVPERRTLLHAVADNLLDSCLDRPKCDVAGRSDTSSGNIELPTDQLLASSEPALKALTSSVSVRMILAAQLPAQKPYISSC